VQGDGYCVCGSGEYHCLAFRIVDQVREPQFYYYFVPFFFNESLRLPLQPLNIIFVDNSQFHNAPCHFLKFIFFSFLWLCLQGQSPTFHSFQHPQLITPRPIICIEGPRSYCQSTNTKLQLQHGYTSDIYPAPLPFHSLR